MRANGDILYPASRLFIIKYSVWLHDVFRSQTVSPVLTYLVWCFTRLCSPCRFLTLLSWKEMMLLAALTYNATRLTGCRGVPNDLSKQEKNESKRKKSSPP